VVGTVSPIREELDEEPDELSILGEGGSTVRKTTVDASALLNGTPVSVLAQKRLSSASIPKSTPVVNRSGSVKATSRKSVPRRSKSAELPPAAPGMAPNGRPRISAASRVAPQEAQDESEDELSPPQVNGSTPRVIASRPVSEAEIPQEDVMGEDEDELSSPVQQTSAQKPPAARKASEAEKRPELPKEQPAAEPKRRGRPKRIVVDEDEASNEPAPVQTKKHGRPTKIAQAEKAQVSATPAAKPRRKQQATEQAGEEDQLDELSPDKDRAAEPPTPPAKRGRDVVEDDADESDAYREPEPEQEPTPRPAPKRSSPHRKQHAKAPSQQPQKRHKLIGPKRAISVMRIKGSTVRGITVADTTRTILEDTIDHRLNRMVGKMQTCRDSAQRKELGSDINMSLSFKESLNEKLLDLQDANDVLSTNFKKIKLFKRDNAELRKDILALQNSRQEVALEHDDVQAGFDDEKAKVDARTKLSEDMFDIEAAIQNGRTRARQEGREDEGPQIPLSMLLGMVGRDVGSFGGGLLAHIKGFNSTLERAAGWLEGRT
jgi:hypothetical protein